MPRAKLDPMQRDPVQVDPTEATGDPSDPPAELRDFRLDDALTAGRGRILISGTQALVRLALT